MYEVGDFVLHSMLSLGLAKCLPGNRLQVNNPQNAFLLITTHMALFYTNSDDDFKALQDSVLKVYVFSLI